MSINETIGHVTAAEALCHHLRHAINDTFNTVPPTTTENAGQLASPRRQVIIRLRQAITDCIALERTLGEARSWAILERDTTEDSR